ncbi:biotin/lipoate--protein ligase family protein [Litoreibacter roseus]|uniref:Biotin-(Acetyl-CoA carboxylase) ligase n=1 Tax=Litoreibacter roseus TaxID=2601869 RepID=A0A6N6J9T3_9RHOB|nr:biotin/lipoate--protein ligase family protein [Litoreibacter roseus]GFE63011.1 hypothetical protein KIN_00850 [Litoreibacter roseus]
MTVELSFPPLLSGHRLEGAADPFEVAQAQAAAGCDAGLVVYNLRPTTLDAAIVLAPEVPLQQAMAMLPVCGVGFQNALGALSPPEVAVHLEWDGTVRINGARCGRFTPAAATTDPETQPDWLVIGLTLTLWPESDDTGHQPDQTALYAEGCADVDAAQLLESWARHTLVWINRWSEEGNAPLHKDWRGMAHGIGEDITVAGKTGTFLGVDEDFGLLLRRSDQTDLIPLTTLLESSP